MTTFLVLFEKALRDHGDKTLEVFKVLESAYFKLANQYMLLSRSDNQLIPDDEQRCENFQAQIQKDRLQLKEINNIVNVIKKTLNELNLFDHYDDIYNDIKFSTFLFKRLNNLNEPNLKKYLNNQLKINEKATIFFDMLYLYLSAPSPRPDKIVSALKALGYDKVIQDLFIQTWSQEIELAYSAGAVEGVLPILPRDVCVHIATFFSRKDGGHLARTCKRAHDNAIEERNKAAELIFKNASPF